MGLFLGTSWMHAGREKEASGWYLFLHPRQLPRPGDPTAWRVAEREVIVFQSVRPPVRQGGVQHP